MRRRLPFLALAAAVAAAALAPYLRVAGFGLINLDDGYYVVSSPVAAGVSWASLKWAFVSFGYQSTWMPLTWLSYLLDISLFGGAPGTMHLHNALLHALNAALVFALLARVLNAGARSAAQPRGPQGQAPLYLAAALAALFWALHPLRVEPVAWVASRKDVLSLFWELLALLFWVKACGPEDAGASRPKPAVWRWLSLACFAFACMAKPAAMTFPALAALLEWRVSRRVRCERYFVPFLMALAVAGAASYAQSAGGATLQLGGVPFHARLANAVAAFGSYCWKTVWPTGLAVPYLHAWPQRPAFFWPGLALCAAYGAALAWCGVRLYVDGATLRERPPSFLASPHAALFAGLAWFLVAVAPMLGLANFGYHSHADRFTYLPAIGFSLALAPLLYAEGPLRELLAGSRRRALVYGAWLLLLAALGAGAWRQAQYWRNDETLLRHTLAVTGETNYAAQKILGLHTFGKSGDAAEALPYIDAFFKNNRANNRRFQVVYVFLLAKAGRLAEAQAEARDLSEWAEQQRNQGIERRALTSGEAHAWGAGWNGTDDFSLETRLCYGLIAYYGGDRALAREHAEAVALQNRVNVIAQYLLGQIALDEGRAGDAAGHWRACMKDPVLFAFLKARIAELEER